MTRRAISPRFATRTRWNMLEFRVSSFEFRVSRSTRNSKLETRNCSGWVDPEQDLVELDEVAVLDAHLGDGAGTLGRDVVEDLHRLDLADDRVRGDAGADLHVVVLVRGRLGVERADQLAPNLQVLPGRRGRGWGGGLRVARRRGVAGGRG